MHENAIASGSSAETDVVANVSELAERERVKSKEPQITPITRIRREIGEEALRS
jgi:hypothetical protein